MPDLRAEPPAAVGAFYLVGENAHATIACAAFASSRKLRLHHIEYSGTDYGFVVSFHIVLWHLTLILQHVVENLIKDLRRLQ